jgi:proline dehydrogenase
MRTILIYLSQAVWARNLVTRFALARRVALRFVAGETLSDAINTVRGINATGMLATVDLLGEHSHSAEAAKVATRHITDAVSALAKNDLRASISLKLTQIGLALDQDICAENLRHILEIAKKNNIFVRVDMEDSANLAATLILIEQMRAEGYSNIGAVIQSYLYRSDQDISDLLQNEITIRLVKGAYKESPHIAYPKKEEVDQAFDRQTALMLDASLKNQDFPKRFPQVWPPLAAIGSHDERRVQYALDYADSIELPKHLLEFQMLYGIRRDLQKQLVDKGYPVRVYVPFGEEWYPYFMRRLAERPANLWFFLSNLVRRN